jgi:hypothetical protein
LTPWRRGRERPPTHAHALALPRTRINKVWSETWQSADQRLTVLETLLREQHVPARRGGAYDNWDLEVRGGIFAHVRLRLGIEEFAGGKQFVCFRSWPCFIVAGGAIAILPALLAVGAHLQGATAAAALLGGTTVALILRAIGDYSAATSSLVAAIKRYEAAQGVAVPLSAAIDLPENSDARASAIAPKVRTDPPASQLVALQDELEPNVGRS